MGIFDFLFGSEQKAQQTTTLGETVKAKRDVAEASRQETVSEKTGVSTTEQKTQQQQVTRNLDPQTQAILQDLIASISGRVETGGGTVLDPKVLGAVGGNLDFANLLAERASKTEGVIGGQTEAIVAEARRTGENVLEAQGTTLARGAGSNLNSIVQAAIAQGRGDLETSLAALEGKLGIEARQAGSQDLATAMGALLESGRAGADISIAGQAAGTQQISQLAQILSGATQEVTGVTTAAGTTTSEEQMTQLVDILRTLVEESSQTRATEQTGATKQTGRDSLVGQVAGLIGAFNN